MVPQERFNVPPGIQSGNASIFDCQPLPGEIHAASVTNHAPITEDTSRFHNESQMRRQDYGLAGREPPMAIRKELSNFLACLAANGSIAASHEAFPRKLSGMRLMATAAPLLINRMRIDGLRSCTETAPTERKEKRNDDAQPKCLNADTNQTQIAASFQTSGEMRPAPQ